MSAKTVLKLLLSAAAVISVMTLNAQEWHGIRLETEVRYRASEDPRAEHRFTKRHTKEAPKAYEKYDNKGHVIETGEYGEQYCERHFATNAERKRSDSTGGVISIFYYVSHYDKLKEVSFNTLDTHGHVVHQETWKYHNNVKTKLKSYSLFTYDESGRQILKLTYDEDSIQVGLQRWLYNDGGDCIYEADSNYSEGNIVLHRDFDDDHHCTKETMFSLYEGKRVFRHMIVSGKDISVCMADSTDKIQAVTEVRKSWNGMPLEETHYESPWGEKRTVYTYDKYDAMTEKKEYRNSELAVINRYKYIINKKRAR
ncbi:MAG: hypothetical protein JSS76_16010 [Bacteroidetes bacterium]|nr:hypothetical protein [Bacteroidota bacterium]